MEIEMLKAYIVTERGKKALTKATARQFPAVKHWSGAPTPSGEPLGKVLGQTLDKDLGGWFVLYYAPHLSAYAWYCEAKLPNDTNLEDIPLLVL